MPGITRTNGDTSDVRAGEGLVLGGRVSILNDAKNLELELTVNAKIQLVAARNANVTWVRLPLDVVVFYRASKFRLGAGATYHLSPEVSESGDASHVRQTYGPALGYVIQADYLFSGAGEGKDAYLGVRYTSIDYKLEGGGFKAGANSFGLHLGYASDLHGTAWRRPAASRASPLPQADGYTPGESRLAGEAVVGNRGR